MLVYWVMFGIFAVVAMLRPDGRATAEYSSTGVQSGEAPRRSLVPIFTGLFLIVVIGLRYRVGGDWSNYEADYLYIEYLDLGQAFTVSRQELAYTLINWLSAQAGGGMGMVNVLAAIPFTVGLIRLSQRLGNAALALAIATPFLIIVVGMGFTRQAAALGFLMIALVELLEKKSLKRFIAYVLLGALFHRTLLIFIPIVLLGSARTWIDSALLAAIALPTAYFTLIRESLDQYGSGYLQSNYDAQGASVRVAMNLLPAVLLLLSGNVLFRTREEQYVWRTFAVLAILAAAALYFIESSVIVDRLSIYLIPLQLFVYTRIAEQASSSSSSSWTSRGVILLYSATVMFVWLNYAQNAWGWVPYGNYLFAE